ncbi:hypothetical protein D9756_003632 [Leucocoprinus leucothites]|uniref:Enoyl reductase (ER) domain-containing protein n=1 Tax=Leucocoprinus leucothites TaxID=201217 RepID=A0A8H5G7T6_9AGAR|nr:hypothetical protein D9756_003632 [Leucoagaricus leucothites]
MQNTQNALFLNHKHADFTLGLALSLKLGDGEILVKIRAAALNPVDWKIQKWGFLVEEYPAVLGSDVAGDVVAVGTVSLGLLLETDFGSSLPYPDYSAFQEYCKLKEDFSAKIPSALSYEQASTFPCALLAAYQGLYNDASLLSNYHHCLPQTHAEKLKSLGATHIIDRTILLDSIHTRLVEIIGSGVKYIFDAVSEPETQKATYDLLSPGGKLALVLPVHVPMDSEEKIVSFTIGYPDAAHNRVCVKTMYSGIEALIEEGTLKPSNIEIVPGGLGVIVENLQRLENNQVSGVKLIIRPSDN